MKVISGRFIVIADEGREGGDEVFHDCPQVSLQKVEELFPSSSASRRRPSKAPSESRQAPPLGRVRIFDEATYNRPGGQEGTLAMVRLRGEVFEYRLYCDESGDHTFQQIDIDNHRYLGLLGVWFRQKTNYREFFEGLEAFKESIFGRREPDDEPLCFHRKDILERKGIFGRLCNAELNRRFESGLLELLANGHYKMACVVLDKNSHGSKTYRELYHPYHYCLAALLERYAGWLEKVGDKGDVMAESRAKKEDRSLSEAFERVYSGGTRFHSAEQFQRVLTSKKLKLKKKEHNIAGLQLADLLAYPFRREMILERRGEPIPQDFSAELLDAARPKINKHLFNGSVSGWGKVWLS